MKKRILLFTSSLLVLSATMMSYNIGPARMFGENRTGAAGGQNTCSGSGCHSSVSPYVSSSETISIYDLQFNQVSSWVPGQTYVIFITATTNAPKFGFQVSASYNDGSYHPAGLFEATNPGTHDTVINGYSIVEQDAAFVVSNTTATKSMKWTAPALPLTDTVYFYCTLNNVNGNGTVSGDNSTNFRQKLGCATASVPQLNANLKINTYPNPVTDELNISIDHADKGTYTISVIDMQGKLVNRQTAEVNGAYKTSVNTTAWTAGMYHVQLKKDGAQKTMMIVKE
jgi:hypothetical protein